MVTVCVEVGDGIKAHFHSKALIIPSSTVLKSISPLLSSQTSKQSSKSILSNDCIVRDHVMQLFASERSLKALLTLIFPYDNNNDNNNDDDESLSLSFIPYALQSVSQFNFEEFK